MVNAAGKVIWSSSDGVLPSAFTQVDIVPYDKLVADAALIEAVWRQAGRIIARNIVATLQEAVHDLATGA